jgi:hypothetical protein
VTLTYVYCIVRSARRPTMPRIAPMPGAASLRALTAGTGLWLIVSDVPAREYAEEALIRGLQDLQWVGSRAMAHEAVVERFLNARAVLPMKLFTLFTSDDRALSHVRRNARRIERVLARVDRQLEWGVRLTFDEQAAHAGGSVSGARPHPQASDESGAAYLSRKKEARDRSRLELERARSAGERCYREVARQATAARRRKALEQAPQASRLIIDAAFLVPARRAAAFRAEVRRQARTLSTAGLAVALTGPWPPYNFVGSGSGR